MIFLVRRQEEGVQAGKWELRLLFQEPWIGEAVTTTENIASLLLQGEGYRVRATGGEPR